MRSHTNWKPQAEAPPNGEWVCWCVGELVWDLVLGNFYGLMVLNFLFLFFLLRCSVLEDFKKHFPHLL